MLFWTVGLSSLGDEVELTKVELPRLGLSFDVTGGDNANDLPRLASVDEAGWFVSDARLNGVGSQLHHVVALTNAAGDTQLIVPNCRVERVRCTDAPLCAEYIALPESVQNEAAACDGERYFLVPFHTGPRDFLKVPPNRAAYAKLLLLRVVVRDWAGAAALIEKLPMVDDDKLIPPKRGDSAWKNGGCVLTTARVSYNETVRLLREGKSADEIGLLLQLMLRTRDAEAVENAASFEGVYRTYLRGLDGIVSACQLSLDQEIALADVIPRDGAATWWTERQCALLAMRDNGGTDTAPVTWPPTATELMRAHRDGGALGELFEKRQARAELARAHVALSAERPPPLPNAPFIMVEKLAEIPTGVFFLSSSWTVDLRWRVPDILPLSPDALNNVHAATAASAGDELSMSGAALTGFELLILEYHESDADNPTASVLETSTVLFNFESQHTTQASGIIQMKTYDEPESQPLVVAFREAFRKRAGGSMVLSAEEILELTNCSADDKSLESVTNRSIYDANNKAYLRMGNDKAGFDADKKEYDIDEYIKWAFAVSSLKRREYSTVVDKLRPGRAYGFRVRTLNRIGVSVASKETMPRLVTPPGQHKAIAGKRHEQWEFEKTAKILDAKSRTEMPVKSLQYLRPARPFSLDSFTPVRVPTAQLMPVLQNLFQSIGVQNDGTVQNDNGTASLRPLPMMPGVTPGPFDDAWKQATGFGLLYEMLTGGVRLGLAEALEDAAPREAEENEDSKAEENESGPFSVLPPKFAWGEHVEATENVFLKRGAGDKCVVGDRVCVLPRSLAEGTLSQRQQADPITKWTDAHTEACGDIGTVLQMLSPSFCRVQFERRVLHFSTNAVSFDLSGGTFRPAIVDAVHGDGTYRILIDGNPVELVPERSLRKISRDVVDGANEVTEHLPPLVRNQWVRAPRRVAVASSTAASGAPADQVDSEVQIEYQAAIVMDPTPNQVGFVELKFVEDFLDMDKIRFGFDQPDDEVVSREQLSKPTTAARGGGGSVVASIYKQGDKVKVAPLDENEQGQVKSTGARRKAEHVNEREAVII